MKQRDPNRNKHVLGGVCYLVGVLIITITVLELLS